MTQQQNKELNTFVGTVVISNCSSKCPKDDDNQSLCSPRMFHRVIVNAGGTVMINMQLESLDGQPTKFAAFGRKTQEDSESVGDTMLRTNREGTMWSVDYTSHTSDKGYLSHTIKKASAVNSKPAPQPTTVQAPPVSQATPPPATPVDWTELLDPVGKSIIRQVAFKGAIQKAEDPKDVYRLTDAYERILLGKPLEDDEHEEEDLFIEVAE